MGFLSSLAQEINRKGDGFGQHDLERILAHIYSPENLAPMVVERYPIVPCIGDYKIIIAESVQAHFLGMDHIAVAGLMPVIEGAGKKLAESRKVGFKGATSGFANLANDCKDEVLAKNIGAVDEILSMMDSFIEFSEKHLYIGSTKYSLLDKTNRHGILHGAYTDLDYGRPINFYKAIAAVDFLCFIASLRASISSFAPNATERSDLLVKHYRMLVAAAKNFHFTPTKWFDTSAK